MFKEILEEVVNSVDGVKGVCLMGMDGIAIEQVVSDGNVNVDEVGVEIGSIIKKIEELSPYLKGGNLREFDLIFEEYLVVVRKVTEDYFVFIILDPYGNFGKARYYIRKVLPDIRRELG